MRLFYKRSICIAFVILSQIFLLSGCTEKPVENADKSIPEKSDFVSYCAKEETEENRIFYKFPQFNKTIDRAEKFNEIIVMFVKTALQEMCVGDIKVNFEANIEDSPENYKWDTSSYTIQAMHIDYRIERSDSDFFSVTFEGLYNNKAAAHPINYFNSLTIDLKKGEVVTLSELYRIDSDFVELIQEKFNEQIPAWLVEEKGYLPNEISGLYEEIVSSYGGTILLESLQQTDKNSDCIFHSYLSNTALGISVPLIYALGDHIEIMIAYEELEQFRN